MKADEIAKLIPPEVEAAAAKALAAVRMPNYTWDDLDREMKAYFINDARAAIAAALAAWPGAYTDQMAHEAQPKRLILPLTEARDE